MVGAMLPARVQSSLVRLGKGERRAKIGQMMNPTAARATARPVGTGAARSDFYDRMGPSLMRAVRTLIGQPDLQPTSAGQIPRSPWTAPSGPPERMDHAAALGGEKPWESIASGAQKTFDEAESLLQNMQDGTATSQAELLAIQEKFTKSQMMFKMASMVMKTAHDTRKQMIQNLRP